MRNHLSTILQSSDIPPPPPLLPPRKNKAQDQQKNVANVGHNTIQNSKTQAEPSSNIFKRIWTHIVNCFKKIFSCCFGNEVKKIGVAIKSDTTKEASALTNDNSAEEVNNSALNASVTPPPPPPATKIGNQNANARTLADQLTKVKLNTVSKKEPGTVVSATSEKGISAKGAIPTSTDLQSELQKKLAQRNKESESTQQPQAKDGASLGESVKSISEATK